MREAQLVDSTSQLVFPAAGKWRRPSLGKLVLRYGHSRTGWVTYALPTAAGRWRVQVTLDSGTAPRTGQWRIPARTLGPPGPPTRASEPARAISSIAWRRFLKEKSKGF